MTGNLSATEQSITQTQPLLDLFLVKINAYFKQRAVAVFKLGSLGKHGDFSSCSDVDVAIVLDAIQVSDYEIVKTINDEIKLSGLEFADRLSIFWSTYSNDNFTKGEGRFPALDRLDFIQNAILLQGIDKRHELKAPIHEEIVLESAKFITTYMLTGEKLLQLMTQAMSIAKQGARYFSKFVLFPVRLIFTLNHTGIVDSNRDAVNYFNVIWKKDLPTEVAELINYAYQARQQMPSEPIRIDEQLMSALPILYRYCLEQYAAMMLKLQQEEISLILNKILQQLRSNNDEK